MTCGLFAWFGRTGLYFRVLILSEPLLTYYGVNPREHTSMKFEANTIIFIQEYYLVMFSTKCQPFYSVLYPLIDLVVSVISSLLWRNSERDGVSNHQPHDCLLNSLFRRRSKKTSKPRVTGLCAGNSPVTGEFPAQMASDAANASI